MDGRVDGRKVHRTAASCIPLAGPTQIPRAGPAAGFIPGATELPAVLLPLPLPKHPPPSPLTLAGFPTHRCVPTPHTPHLPAQVGLDRRVERMRHVARNVFYELVALRCGRALGEAGVVLLAAQRERTVLQQAVLRRDADGSGGAWVAGRH
eukprot:5647-Chlamydomonas_euryale.AAC.5